MLALVIPPTMLFNFFTAVKVLFLMPLLMIAIGHIIVTRRLRVWWVALGLLVMSAFYPVASTYRDFQWGNDISFRPEQSQPFVIGKVEVSTEPF